MKRSRMKPSQRTGQKAVKRGHHSWFNKNVILLLTVLAVIFLGATWKIILHQFLHVKKPSSILTVDWKRYTPGQTGLSLELPGEPHLQNSAIPEALRSRVRLMKRFKYAFEEFDVAVWETLFNESISVDVQKSAEDAATTLKQSQGVTGYQDTINPVTLSGRPGVRVTGTFDQFGLKKVVNALLIGDGSRLWQIIIIYRASDADAPIAARRVLDSVGMED